LTEQGHPLARGAGAAGNAAAEGSGSAPAGGWKPRRPASSEAVLRLALESGGMGVWQVDLRRGMVTVDDRLKDLFGVAHEDGYEFPIARLDRSIHPADLPGLTAARERAHAGEPFAAEYRVVLGDGSERWLAGVGEMQPDETGALTYGIGLIYDITERKRTEGALRRNEALLHGVISNIDANVYAKDRRGRFVLCNDALATLYRTPQEQIIGRAFDDVFFTPEDAARIRANDMAVMTSGQSLRVEEAAVDDDGRERTYLSIKSPLREPDGSIVGIVGVTTDITDRKQAEEALRASEARLRTLLDQLFAFVGVLTPDGVLLHANRAPLEAAGLQPDDVWGKRFEDCYWWSYSERVQEQLRDAMARAAQGEVVRYDVRVRMAGGRLMPIDFQVAPLRDNAGTIIGLIPSAIDIEQRLKAEDAMRLSEARFRATFENAAVGIAHVGMAGEWLRVNDRLCEIVGYPRDELLRKTFQDITHPDDIAPDLEKFEPMMRGELSGYRMEKRYYRKDGTLIWVTLTASLQRADDDTPLYCIAVVEDITERKRAEAALAESEARFREMADNAPVMVWVTGADSRCTFLSRSWYDFTGQTPETGLGFGWLGAIHPADRDDAHETFLAANARCEAFRLEYRLRRADGAYRWVIDAAAPRRGGDGAFLGYIGSVIDIDERHKAEEHRKLMIDELNHRVKNTLAVVQGMAHRTFKGVSGAPQAMQAFEGRLQAFSAAHNLLTRGNWERADLAVLAPAALEAPWRDRRVEIDGPPLMLQPKQAVTIAMALHELCTNAIKYGALSNETGRVAVDWSVTDGPRFELVWRERGGPPVSPPKRRGFGLLMIEQALANDLHAEVTMDFRPEGLTCTIGAALPTAERDTQ